MGIQVDISSKLNVDTSEAQQKIRELGGESFQSLITPPTTPPLSTGNTVNDLENPIDPTKDNVEEAKKSNGILNNILNLLQTKTTNDDYNRRSFNYNGVNNTVATSENTLRQLINYDLIGATRGTVSHTGRALQNTATNLSNEGNNTAGLASLLGGLGTFGIVAGALIGVGGALGNKVLGEYEKNLPSTEDLYRAYGGNISNRDYKDNASLAVAMGHNIQSLSLGTGLTNAEFMAQTADYARYGVSDYMEAGRNTRSAMNLSRMTGTNFDEIQRLQGLNSRFNGVDGSSTVDQLYKQLAQNGVTIEDVQKYMPELIANITMAMETGIDKGFSRSVADVADSVSFISNLSGNEAWKKNAGKTYASITQGLAGAVNLSDSNDLIAYSAINNMSPEDIASALGDTGSTGNAYLDKALILENGATAPLVQAVHKQIKSVYGDDMLSGVMSYKDMYGLNTKGAVTLYNALNNPNNSQQDIDDVLNQITSDSQYKSDSTKMNDTLNSINDNVQDAGQSFYELKEKSMGLLEDVTGGVNRIISLMGGDAYSSVVEKIADVGFMSNEKTAKKDFKEALINGLKNPSTSNKYQKIMDYFNDIGAGKVMTLNLTDELQNIDWTNPDKALDQLMKLGGEDGENILTQKPQTKAIQKDMEATIENIRNNSNFTNKQKEIAIDNILQTGTIIEATTTNSGNVNYSNNVASGYGRTKDLGENGTYGELNRVIQEIRDNLKHIANDGIPNLNITWENFSR